MKRYLFLLLVLVFFACSGYSQKLQVESFKLVENDLSAQTQPRKDLNDKNCALVKVQFVGTISEAEGNVVMPLVKRGNETWIYMPQGSRQLKLLTQSYLPLAITFSDYGIEKIESNRTYVLVLARPLSSVELQKQSLTIKYSPSSATVLIDNKMVKGNNGVAKATLPIGQHSFVVFCDGYESEEGTVKLKTTAPSNLQIVLSQEMTYSSNSIENVHSDSSQHSDMNPHSISSSNSLISIPIKDGVCIEMVKIAAGTFMMGATSEIKDAFKDEKPVHQVTLTNDYYIGKYEVTQEQWLAIMGRNPSYFRGDNLPVERVSWNDCQEFIVKLNAITGKKFRLPTEAEWEYAARGGLQGRGYQYIGGNNVSAVSWYEGNSMRKTHPVGTKQANELGICDMAGNVWEWCRDLWGTYPKKAQTNPMGAINGSKYVIRGGGCNNNALFCRVSYRFGEDQNSRNLIGMRLVLSDD